MEIEDIMLRLYVYICYFISSAVFLCGCHYKFMCAGGNLNVGYVQIASKMLG